MSKIINFSIILVISLLNSPIHSADKTITINDSISIYIKEDSIDYKTYFKNYGEVKYLGWTSFIDNKPVFGIDDEPPNTILSKLIFMINKEKINLDVSYMYNPHFPQIDKNSFRLHIKDDLITFTMSFSDGTGSYAAQWLIFENQSFRTIITSNEGISDLLFKEGR